MTLAADLFTPFFVVFLAEFGDKSQLAIIALSARHGRRPVLLGSLAAFAVLTAAAVLAGAALSRFVGAAYVEVLAGGVFLLFAALAWRATDEAKAPVRPEPPAAQAAVALRVFALVFVSEMLDKTQLATAALAAVGNPFLVALGSFAALAVGTVLAVLAGRWLAPRVPAKVIRLASAALFAALGAWLEVRGLLALRGV